MRPRCRCRLVGQCRDESDKGTFDESQMFENFFDRPTPAHRSVSQLCDAEITGGQFNPCECAFLCSENPGKVSVRQCVSSRFFKPRPFSAISRGPHTPIIEHHGCKNQTTVRASSFPLQAGPFDKHSNVEHHEDHDRNKYKQAEARVEARLSCNSPQQQDEPHSGDGFCKQDKEKLGEARSSHTLSVLHEYQAEFGHGKRENYRERAKPTESVC